MFYWFYFNNPPNDVIKNFPICIPCPNCAFFAKGCSRLFLVLSINNATECNYIDPNTQVSSAISVYLGVANPEREDWRSGIGIYHLQGGKSILGCLGEVSTVCPGRKTKLAKLWSATLTCGSCRLAEIPAGCAGGLGFVLMRFLMIAAVGQLCHLTEIPSHSIIKYWHFSAASECVGTAV